MSNAIDAYQFKGQLHQYKKAGLGKFYVSSENFLHNFLKKAILGKGSIKYFEKAEQ